MVLAYSHFEQQEAHAITPVTLLRLRDIAQRQFSTAEYTAMQALPERDCLLAFLRCWTRKEACMKATGCGLSLAPSTFECGVHAAPERVRVSALAREWTLLVHSPEVSSRDIVVSWAVVLA